MWTSGRSVQSRQDGAGGCRGGGGYVCWWARGPLCRGRAYFGTRQSWWSRSVVNMPLNCPFNMVLRAFKSKATGRWDAGLSLSLPGLGSPGTPGPVSLTHVCLPGLKGLCRCVLCPFPQPSSPGQPTPPPPQPQPQLRCPAGPHGGDPPRRTLCSAFVTPAVSSVTTWTG